MKELTLAEEDSKYGVKLQGEPDSDRLGKRLKADFRKVAPAVKALSTQQLEEFQEKGEIVVEGHTLTSKDIRVHSACDWYTFVSTTCAVSTERQRGCQVWMYARLL